MTRRGESRFRKNARRTYTAILGEHDRAKDYAAKKALEGTGVNEIANRVIPQRDPLEMARAAQEALRGAA